MTDERKNIKTSGETFNLLKTAKPAGVTWDRYLTQLVRDSTNHTVVVKERSGPTGSYIACEECGRSENTLEELDRRPCKEGIAVDE